jgi:cytochrome c oxidase subunit 2
MKNYLMDVAEEYQIGFQDAASPIMEGIINFHNYVFIYMSYVIALVVYMLVSILIKYSKGRRNISHKYLVHGTQIELVWTITPAIILVLIAFPSFQLLYLMDEVIEPGITIKVIGHQWYWSYEYSDYAPAQISFDAYMVPESDLAVGEFRLLEVTNKVVVPVDTHVRVIVTAADVLHSWAVPSLGVKVDAIPGRLNQTGFIALREGTFYGQCSEICGANHAYMPIAVQAVSLGDYCAYVKAAATTD